MYRPTACATAASSSPAAGSPAAAAALKLDDAESDAPNSRYSTTPAASCRSSSLSRARVRLSSTTPSPGTTTSASSCCPSALIVGAAT